MPREDLLENGLPIPYNRLPMARHDILRAPGIDALHALPEALAVTAREHIPQHALLPLRVAPRVLDAGEQPRRPARPGALARLAVLLGRGQVEQQVGLDQRLGRLVEEHQLLVRVGVDELVLEVGVELLADADGLLAGLGEDGGEGQDGDRLVASTSLGALLSKPLGADEVCFGEGRGPAGEEDVVLEVGGGDVGDGPAELGERALDGGGEGDGGEDGEGAGGEFYCVMSVLMV
jgi:hypothetical protein